MPQLLIKFERRFQIWSYTASHGYLLLRSAKTSEYPSQIDVAFKNTAAIHLPTVFDAPRILKASAEEWEGQQPILGALPHAHQQLFIITGAGFEGYVVAGHVAWLEEDREYDSPSRLISIP